MDREGQELAGIGEPSLGLDYAVGGTVMHAADMAAKESAGAQHRARAYTSLNGGEDRLGTRGRGNHGVLHLAG